MPLSLTLSYYCSHVVHLAKANSPVEPALQGAAAIQSWQAVLGSLGLLPPARGRRALWEDTRSGDSPGN